MKKNFMHSKIFAVVSIVFGLFGLLLITHHIVSYNNVLMPYMDDLIVNKVITNNVNGATFLCYFTNQSNIFVDVYLILFGIGVLGNKKLYDFTHNEKLRGAVTLYICITGIIYFTVLLPFSKGGFPMEKSIWFSNVVNYWNHLVTPVAFTALWFKPVAEKREKLPVVKSALLSLVYPLCYFVFSVVRGGIVDFYPYPFLSGKQMWEMLFKGQEYNALLGALLLAAAFVLLCGIFFGVGCALFAIHNKIVKKKVQ